MKEWTVLFAYVAFAAFAQPSMVTAFAQPDTLRIPSMEAVRQQNVWLAGTNPVALSMNSFHSFSVAEVGYGHLSGAFGNPMLPASADRYGVRCESYQTLGSVSLYGQLGYAMTRERDVNWNGMTPSSQWSAANLCDSVSGNRRAEQYELTGAFSLPLGRQWAVGAQFDYDVQQTAKDTDPRNRNDWMEWRLIPGIAYERGAMRLGASLLYVSSAEGVDYRNVGSHVTYPVFISYPVGFFATLPGGEPIEWRYTRSEVGGALQMGIVRRDVQFFQQLGGGIIREDVERNRVENRCESETEAWRLMYTARLQRLAPHARHEWAVGADYKQANNYDPLQRQQAGSPWQTYGRVLRSTWHEGIYKLAYSYHRLRDAWHPRFSVLCGVTFRQTESALLFYPVEYIQPLHRLTADVRLKRNVLLPCAHLDVSVGACYGTGGGSILNEKRQDGQEQPDIRLWMDEELRQRVYRYEVASRWKIDASLTYTREPKRSLVRWFVRLSGQYEQGVKSLIQTEGSEISTQVGILF